MNVHYRIFVHYAGLFLLVLVPWCSAACENCTGKMLAVRLLSGTTTQCLLLVPFHTNNGIMGLIAIIHMLTVADPGFPVGGRRPHWGRQPLSQVLFGKNVCENERIGSHCGEVASGAPWICHWLRYIFEQCIL